MWHSDSNGNNGCNSIKRMYPVTDKNVYSDRYLWQQFYCISHSNVDRRSDATNHHATGDTVTEERTCDPNP